MKPNRILRLTGVPVLVFLISYLISGCTMSESGLKRSTGSSNEILVVTNDKETWLGAPGDSIRAFFGAEFPGLSQPEPMFDLVNIAAGDLNDLFKKYHNILIVEINPQADGAMSESKKNLWAEPQMIIKLSAPDLPSFYSEFERNRETYLRYFVELERERTLVLQRMSSDIKLARTVENKFGISLPIPGGFYLAKEGPDFAWLRHKVTKAKQDVELSIMIYSMPYRDTLVFDPRHIIQWRNTITLEHIPGPSPGSFMKISQQFIPPVFDTVAGFPGGFAVETRGLWEVENDFMGGPFVSYTFADTLRHNVITLDGYVYYPNNDKRDYLRQMEAIFYGAKLSEQK